MSTDSATWNVAIDLANRFFPYSSEKQTRNVCIHLGWTIVTLMDLLQSQTLPPSIIQSEETGTMWSFCRISHCSSVSMALHLRSTKWQMHGGLGKAHALQRMGDTSYKVSGPYHFSEVFKGPVVKGIAGTSSPKERSSYFIFHLPLPRRQQKACESFLDSHLELLLLPRRLGNMEILDP